MNRQMLSRLQGGYVEFARPVLRMTESGWRLPALRDRWWVRLATRAGLELENLRTGHVLQLGCDHLYEYRSNLSCDGMLVLRSDVLLRGRRTHLFPLSWPFGSAAW